MAEEFNKNQQEVKNEIRKGIVERLLGSKLDTENAETSADDTTSTAIISGADGPTSIFLAGRLGSETKTETEK